MKNFDYFNFHFPKTCLISLSIFITVLIMMWTRSPRSNDRKKCHRVPRTFHNCHRGQTSRGWEEEPCENFTFLYSFAVYISSRAIYTRLSKLWGFWTERWCNWALMDYAGLYRAVMYCTGLYGATLACTGRQWVIRGVGWSGWPTLVQVVQVAGGQGDQDDQPRSYAFRKYLVFMV